MTTSSGKNRQQPQTPPMGLHSLIGNGWDYTDVAYLQSSNFKKITVLRTALLINVKKVFFF